MSQRAFFFSGFFFVEMVHLNFKVWLNFGLDTDPASARGSVKVSGKKFFTAKFQFKI